MSGNDLARLEGEIYGLKVLLTTCLTHLAESTRDPLATLAAIQSQAVERIAQAKLSNIPEHRQGFREGAAAAVVQVLGEAQAELTAEAQHRGLRVQ